MHRSHIWLGGRTLDCGCGPQATPRHARPCSARSHYTAASADARLQGCRQADQALGARLLGAAVAPPGPPGAAQRARGVPARLAATHGCVLSLRWPTHRALSHSRLPLQRGHLAYALPDPKSKGETGARRAEPWCGIHRGPPTCSRPSQAKPRAGRAQAGPRLPCSEGNNARGGYPDTVGGRGRRAARLEGRQGKLFFSRRMDGLP